MSKLYGTLSGASRTKATRRGHNRIVTQAASWNGAIEVEVYIDLDGVEHYEVRRIPWHGGGADKAATLAVGTLN